MTHRYRIDEANALVAEVAGRMRRLGELQEAAAAAAAGSRRRARLNGHGGGLDPEIAGEIEAQLDWFDGHGLLIKGISPPLVDFPAEARGGEVLLCWTEGETEISYYHDRETGFAGRRPVSELG